MRVGNPVVCTVTATPNTAEAAIAFLATASVGAVWSCCGQDYAARAAADRLGRLEPVVMIASDGYRYGGKNHDRRDALAGLQAAMPSVRTTIVVSRLGLDVSDGLGLRGGTSDRGPAPSQISWW